VASHGPAAPSSFTTTQPLIDDAPTAGEVTQRHHWRQLPGPNHKLAASPPRFGGSRLRPIDVQSIRHHGADVAVWRHFSGIGPGIWFQKHSDWGAEIEYRFVYLDPVGSRSSIEVDITGCVAALVVGADYQEAHLSIARDFNEAFDLQGCVAKSEWVGPHWMMQDIAPTDGTWRWGPRRRVVTHAGTAVRVVMPPLENPTVRFEPPFSDEATDGLDEVKG